MQFQIRCVVEREEEKATAEPPDSLLAPQVITAKDAGKAEPPKDAGAIQAYLVPGHEARSVFDSLCLSIIRAALPSCGSGSFIAYATTARFCTGCTVFSLFNFCILCVT